MINSMTAFSRQQCLVDQGQLIIEIRSVNHRYLETTIKLPDYVRQCEPELRELLRLKISRGKVDCYLHIQPNGAARVPIEINQQQLGALLAAASDVRKQLGDAARMSPLDVLQWPGILLSPQEDGTRLMATIQQLFAQTLDHLNEARQREGCALAAFINTRLEALQPLVQQIREQLPEIISSQQARVRGRLQDLSLALDHNRLEQELVHLAQKIDVAEEMDRLDMHIAEIKHALQKGGACGRRLDFLMQELNREANTLSSKSVAGCTSLAAVDMKVLIEQMREQVQNIE